MKKKVLRYFAEIYTEKDTYTAIFEGINDMNDYIGTIVGAVEASSYDDGLVVLYSDNEFSEAIRSHEIMGYKTYSKYIKE